MIEFHVIKSEVCQGETQFHRTSMIEVQFCQAPISDIFFSKFFYQQFFFHTMTKRIFPRFFQSFLDFPTVSRNFPKNGTKTASIFEKLMPFCPHFLKIPGNRRKIRKNLKKSRKTSRKSWEILENSSKILEQIPFCGKI